MKPSIRAFRDQFSLTPEQLRQGRILDYPTRGSEVRPEILALIRRCNIRNHTIFLREPETLLFATWEYHRDFAADPRMQDWWRIADPMQAPLPSRKKSEWWAPMEEVFHHD